MGMGGNGLWEKLRKMGQGMGERFSQVPCGHLLLPNTLFLCPWISICLDTF